jgi:hypothetical protein
LLFLTQKSKGINKAFRFYALKWLCIKKDEQTTNKKSRRKTFQEKTTAGQSLKLIHKSMKKLFYSTVAVLAFSVSGMANTIKVDKEIIDIVVLYDLAC